MKCQSSVWSCCFSLLIAVVPLAGCSRGPVTKADPPETQTNPDTDEDSPYSVNKPIVEEDQLAQVGGSSTRQYQPGLTPKTQSGEQPKIALPYPELQQPATENPSPTPAAPFNVPGSDPAAQPAAADPASTPAIGSGDGFTPRENSSLQPIPDPARAAPLAGDGQFNPAYGEAPTYQPSAQPPVDPTGPPTGQPTGQPPAQPAGQLPAQPANQPPAQPAGQPPAQPAGELPAQPAVGDSFDSQSFPGPQQNEPALSEPAKADALQNTPTQAEPAFSPPATIGGAPDSAPELGAPNSGPPLENPPVGNTPIGSDPANPPAFGGQKLGDSQFGDDQFRDQPLENTPQNEPPFNNQPTAATPLQSDPPIDTPAFPPAAGKADAARFEPPGQNNPQPEIEDPGLPPAKKYIMRTWRDSSNQFTLQGRLVEQTADNQSVRIELEDGSTVTADIDSLCDRDRGYLELTLDPDALDSLRLWQDASKTYDMEATYVEVDNGRVRLKANNGKTFTIGIGELSEFDRGFIESRDQ